MKDLISVILPVYNVEKYLREALDSVINQTYKNLEIILVDDGSPDNSGKICDEYAVRDNRIKVIHKKNGGVSSARNAGIDVAIGDWLYFMDPDDWIELNMLAEALNKAIETNSDLCIWDYERVNKNKRTHYNAIKSNCTFFNNTDDLDTAVLFNCGMGSVCNFIIKSKIIKNNIYFDETISFREDEIFKLEMYQFINSFCYLPVAFYHYRMIDTSACHKIEAELLIEKNKKIYHKGYNIILNGKYPLNAEIIASSKFLESFTRTVDLLTDMNCSFFDKKKIYDKYIRSDEFISALNNYDRRYFGKFAKICLKFKNIPYFFVSFSHKWLRFCKRFIK